MHVERQCRMCGEQMSHEIHPDRTKTDLHSPDKLIPLLCGCTAPDEGMLYETVDFGDILDEEGNVVWLRVQGQLHRVDNTAGLEG